MMEFNDMVTVVDQRERELRELEVLVKLVPFVERDVEERCAKLDEDAQGMVALMRGVKAVKPGCLDDVEENNVYEDYERMKGRENERLERLRRAILERAERLFPELAAEEPQDKGESFSSGAQGEGGSLSAREGENARGVSYVDGVVTRQPGESLMK